MVEIAAPRGFVDRRGGSLEIGPLGQVRVGANTQAKNVQTSAQATYDRLLDALPECRNPTGTKLGCGPNFRGPAAKAEAALRDLRSADNVEAATRKNVEISNNTIDSKNALIKGDQTKLKGVEGAQLQVRTA